MFRTTLYALSLSLAVAGAVHAGSGLAPEEVLRGLINRIDSSYLTQSPQNLMMMPDNPAYLVAEDGEALFRQARGPKNASLEQCDFGKGPGVLKGAYVELPRYFADTGRVMDFESRLVHCMKTLQGFGDNDPAIKKRHGADTDITRLTLHVAMQSQDGH